MRGFRCSNKTVQRQEQGGDRKGEESTVGLVTRLVTRLVTNSSV